MRYVCFIYFSGAGILIIAIFPIIIDLALQKIRQSTKIRVPSPMPIERGE